MKNTLQSLRMCYVAAINGSGNQATALSLIPVDGTAPSLQPLTQFGLSLRCP